MGVLNADPPVELVSGWPVTPEFTPVVGSVALPAGSPVGLVRTPGLAGVAFWAGVLFWGGVAGCAPDCTKGL